jgi:thiol:disulfide interchange protein DsbC
MTPRAPVSLAVAARTLTAAAFAASLAIPAARAAESDGGGSPPPASGVNPLAGGIAEMIAMPGGAWRAARVGDSDAVWFISGNGRWVVRGEAYDLWRGERLRDFDAVRASTRTIRLDGLGPIWDDLAPLSFGSGPRDVVVFADPRCPVCETLIAGLRAHENRFRIVVLQIPLLGEASGRLVKSVHCAADRGAALAAVRDHAPAAGLVQRADCDGAPILRRLATAQLIGLQAVPFMIHADGRFIEGAPDDLAAWLEDR